MQSLLLERKLGDISPLQFHRHIVDNYYHRQLAQTAKYNVFPRNCHNGASVNSLSLEKHENRFLLSGCADSSIKLWDLNEQDVVRVENQVDANFSKQSFRHHPSKFDLFDYDNPISVFRAVATIPKRSQHQFGVSTIQWWPFDTGMFVTSSFDHTVKIWDTNELMPVHNFNVNNRVYSIDVNGRKSLIATASDQPFVRILDMKSTSSAHTLKGHKNKTLVVKWHPINENLLATGGYDGEVRIWDIRRSESLLCRLDMLTTNATIAGGSASAPLIQSSVKAHSAPVNGLVWDESGTILYTTGNDDKIRAWDMMNSTYPPRNKLVNFGALTRNKYPQTIPMLLNPKQETSFNYLLFPSESGEILVFRAIDGKLVNRLARRNTKSSARVSSMVNRGCFTGKYICGTVDGEIVSWEPFADAIDMDEIAEIGDDDQTMEVEELLLRRQTLALKAKQLMHSLE
ncbi:uncharacterized protein LODBEIA_P22830 [Lodderomyces beijingensis]|uniref:DNA excision repair protein ERCC-8 n=1 Tax=Lodderomyces beijingensis TaxID=1775926 RepID=A0ABP0ZJL1_9ASCO